MSKDLLVLADEYAAATATFARALALKDSADSMSPIAREAGDKRAVLAEALAALDTAQQEPVNALLVEALERMVESVTGVDQVSAVNEARAALTAAKQAQPEPYGYHSPKTGKVYASTEAASMAMAGEVKTVYLATQAQPALSGCACRWDADDKRVATCVRHQGWLDVVSEWAERAKAAESHQAQPERAPLSDDEIQTIYLRTYNEGFHGRSLEIAFARAIEAAIKQGGQQ